MSNISWSENANYEQLADSYKSESKTKKENQIVDKKTKQEIIPIDKKLLKKVIDNFKESYNSFADNKVYDGIVTLESILNNLN